MYDLKPEWTNIFQKLYDEIKKYDNPELEKQLDELWELVLKAVKEGSSQAIVVIINLIKEYLKKEYGI